jgi:hypothetical protein
MTLPLASLGAVERAPLPALTLPRTQGHECDDRKPEPRGDVEYGSAADRLA